MPPPETQRFCLSCRKMTVWKYNRIVGHSRCQECGGSYSASNELSEEEIQKATRQLMPWILQ